MNIERITLNFKALLATFGVYKLPEPNLLFKNGEADYDTYSHEEKKLFWACHEKPVSNETIKKGLLNHDIFMQINCIAYLDNTGISPQLIHSEVDHLLFNTTNPSMSSHRRVAFIELPTTALSVHQINKILRDPDSAVRRALSKRTNITFTEEQLRFGAGDEMSFISSSYKKKLLERSAHQESIMLASFLNSAERRHGAEPQ
jgi:hypothetical protein